MFDVVKYAEGSSAVVPTFAGSYVTDQENARMRASLVSNLAHLKQEARCSATKSNEGNSKRTLKCDDECTRLERNRRLALALNIDPEAYKNDHIPYSAATLHMFSEGTKWAQTQEREFRVFAADDTERRLRFKPMPPHHRAFLHSLAEDFGFDSESIDPEPHRHVLILKTPRFVMAPMKTLAECARIRTQEAAVSIASETGQRRHQADNMPFNGFLLAGPRFGLTLDELRTDLAEMLSTVPTLSFDISFLPSEEIVLKARPPMGNISTAALDSALRALKPTLASTTTTKALASAVHLCALDASLNILRQEQDAASADGWSQVAAKAAVGARAAPRKPAVGIKSSFTVLGSQVKAARKKKAEKDKEESVVEDWEEEMRRQEEEGTADRKAREETILGDTGAVAADELRVSDVSDTEGTKAEGVEARSGTGMDEDTKSATPSSEEASKSAKAASADTALQSADVVEPTIAEHVASEPAGRVDGAIA
ncbi:FKBP12-associated protein [Xylographa pallens]|nr:FKBP12-associated protein [Xylographa pallens]